jgi:putative two-component system response regulator
MHSGSELGLARLARFVQGLVDGRDPDLAGHNARSSSAATKLCQRIGCTASETELMTVAAELHDLGKMAINEHILNKPARLTKAEFELVTQHPLIGGRLLEPLELDVRIVEVVRYHHENFDGSGYPEGLQSQRIPFLARIMRVIDSFDALTSDRPYHRGVSAADAVVILQKDSRFYDPEVLDSFSGLIQENG